MQAGVEVNMRDVQVLGEAEFEGEVVCATELACHTQGAGLSENKRSVHAMKGTHVNTSRSYQMIIS